MKLALHVLLSTSISFHISLAIFSLDCFRFVSDGQIYMTSFPVEWGCWSSLLSSSVVVLNRVGCWYLTGWQVLAEEGEVSKGGRRKSSITFFYPYQPSRYWHMLSVSSIFPIQPNVSGIDGPIVLSRGNSVILFWGREGLFVDHWSPQPTLGRVR